MSTLVILASISSNEQVSTRALMRSRAPMGKWYWHLVQTLRFSSNSLSKTMVSHLGHLVHRPSGISRFFFLLAPSLGFLTNAVSEPVGGGLSAGSVGSTVAGAFFVNKVAAIARLYRVGG